MKYGDKEIIDLDDSSLLNAYNKCGQSISAREAAAMHDKFKKMEFPLINPKFTQMYNEIKDEIAKRKLI